MQTPTPRAPWPHHAPVWHGAVVSENYQWACCYLYVVTMLFCLSDSLNQDSRKILLDNTYRVGTKFARKRNETVVPLLRNPQPTQSHDRDCDLRRTSQVITEGHYRTSQLIQTDHLYVDPGSWQPYKCAYLKSGISVNCVFPIGNSRLQRYEYFKVMTITFHAVVKLELRVDCQLVLIWATES